MECFRGKRVFITGGSSGIGLDAATRLASMGSYIAIFARNVEKLEAAQNMIGQAAAWPDQSVYALSMDVTDNTDVETKCAQAVSEFGAPDILINSAGAGYADYFEEIPFETFDSVIRTNLYGIRNVAEALVPHMKQRGGHIGNVSSMLGLIGLFGYTPYCASKFAVVGFSECLRMDLKRYGIRVSVFCPPEVDTPMTDYMTEISPPETRALVRMNGIISSEKAADAMLRGISRKRFLILSGPLSKLFFMGKRFFPWQTRMVLDTVAGVAARLKH
jgi:NAD(P)-dependent dehydrogenase (short-subunit alcohol dehydrogenase family)